MLVHKQPLPLLAPAIVHPAPRKRRRRTPPTGAAEDCFTCRANGTKCDRRRPYCGPCLDIGDECKGYRTQLTWGVGVASRGKLRGMAIPVSIESNISVAQRNRSCAVKKKPLDETTIRAKELKNALELSNRLSESDSRPLLGDIPKLNIVTNYDFVNMEHPSAASAIHSTLSRHEDPRVLKSAESPYTTSMVNTPLMMQPSYSSPRHDFQHTQEFPSAMLNLHIPSYPQDPMNSNPPSGLMILSAVSDYDWAYTPHGDNQYSLPPSPSDSSIYDGDLISSLSSPPYFSQSSLAVTSGMPSYAQLIASIQLGYQFMDGRNVHQHRNHYWSHMGLDQPQAPAAVGNPPDLSYGDEMLGTF